MLAKVCSPDVNGIEAYPVEVKVNAGHGDTIIVKPFNKPPNWLEPLICWTLKLGRSRLKSFGVFPWNLRQITNMLSRPNFK